MQGNRPEMRNIALMEIYVLQRVDQAESFVAFILGFFWVQNSYPLNIAYLDVKINVHKLVYYRLDLDLCETSFSFYFASIH